VTKLKIKPTFPVDTKDFWGIGNLTQPKVLLAMATLAALGNVLGFLMIPIGPQAKIDLTTLPLLISACLYGPIPAFITGLLGSLVTIPQFGHCFSPLMWYNIYLMCCALLIKKVRVLFAPLIAFVVLWPTLGYLMNVTILGFPVVILWVIAAKEVVMCLVYGFLVERLLSNVRIRKVFLPQ
jgi:uncharacterized membrane protein